MSKKTFIEKTEEVGPLTVVLDWSMGQYGVSVICTHGNPGSWQSEIYEFKNEDDAKNAFDLAVELCEELNYVEVLP